MITSSLCGETVPGLPKRKAREAEAQRRQLQIGHLFLGEVELYEEAELASAYAAARKAVEAGNGLPGELRKFFAAAMEAKPRALFRLEWIVVATDNQTRPVERQAKLPRLRWPDLAVFDFCGRAGSGRGRYQVMRRINGTGGTDSYVPSGFAFRTVRDLRAYLDSEPAPLIGRPK